MAPWYMETKTKTCGLPQLLHFEPLPNIVRTRFAAASGQDFRRGPRQLIPPRLRVHALKAARSRAGSYASLSKATALAWGPGNPGAFLLKIVLLFSLQIACTLDLGIPVGLDSLFRSLVLLT